jgi:hypothetical protein
MKNPPGDAAAGLFPVLMIKTEAAVASIRDRS